MKVLKPRCLRHFSGRKKTQEVLLCRKEKEKNAVYGNCHLQYHQLFTQCSDNH